jgi:YesN/AraC family two-component response regulator
MEEQHLYIKNMVCPRCIMAVQDTLARAGAHVLEVQLGHARIVPVSGFSKEKAVENLHSLGFEVLQNPEEQLSEHIRLHVHAYLRLTEKQETHQNLSAYLAEQLNKNYASLSRHFRKYQGTTIENYYILCRIERVKALLQEGGLNVSQIAHLLGYSSVHYLSGQFKKVTGASVTDYKKDLTKERRSLDEI